MGGNNERLSSTKLWCCGDPKDGWWSQRAAKADTAGPLSCLWADLLNKDATVSKEDIVMLVQRALVLQVQSRSRFNPKLKSLASEEYDKRKTSLFAQGFLEKASKRIEASKTLDKVSYNPSRLPPKKRARFDNDKDDLRHLLSRATSTWCGGRKNQCQQPYTSYTKFQPSRLYWVRARQAPRDQTPSIKSKSGQLGFSCEFSKQQTDSSVFQRKVYQYSSVRLVPDCWPGSGMQVELGTDYSGPLDIGHSTRIPIRTGVHTSTAISTLRVAF